MTEKEKYIGAFLDGYFFDKKVSYGLKYFEMFDKATRIAGKKWEKYYETQIKQIRYERNKI